MTIKQDSKPAITLGPVVCAAVVCQDLSYCVEVYQEYLDMVVTEQGYIDSELAQAYDLPELAGKRYCLLANQYNDNWLRFIEQPDDKPVKPISTLGWMSLEILVADVYALAERFRNSPFSIIGEPKPLDVSDGIEAFQAIGPAGEVLYLTRVLRDVPPFDLPKARCDVDRLFIPVLLVPEIEESMSLYGDLSQSTPLAFDTKVTVINNALGRPVDQRMPIATIQFKEQSFIEIDQVNELPPRPITSSGLPTGIAIISFLVDSLDDIALPPMGRITQSSSLLYKGRRSALYRGTAGELIELIERE